MHGVVDEKTDVFAFGVFLLEIISGKKSVDSSYQSLHGWVMPFLFSLLVAFSNNFRDVKSTYN